MQQSISLNSQNRYETKVFGQQAGAGNRESAGDGVDLTTYPNHIVPPHTNHMNMWFFFLS